MLLKMNKKRKSAEDAEVETRKSSRQTSNLSSTILPQIWIFSKYKKGTNAREPLRCCAQLRVDQKLKTIATERRDAK